jgi:hydrogenase maturation protease
VPDGWTPEQTTVSATTDNVLVIGYGNPGRRDDGLGPALAAAVERLGIAGVKVDSDYQLTVEDAAAVAEHDLVLFADAACSGAGPFALRRVEPGSAVTFSSHSVQPDGVLALARDLFGATPSAYLLTIRGYAFNEFGEGLSEEAQANLAAAIGFIEPVLRQRTFSEAVATEPCAPLAPAGDN